MKNIIIGILVISIGLMSNCCSGRNKKDDWCQSVVKETADLIFKYQMSDNTEYLDSALYLSNKALGKCSEFNVLLISRKLDILAKKQDFTEATLFIESIETPLIKDLDYYNSYLLQRFLAMQYQLKGDTLKRNDCLKMIIQMLEEFMEKNKNELDSLILHEDVDELLRNSLSIPYIQYYYTKAVLLGIDESKAELDSLRTDSDISEEFLDFIYQYCLDNDFMTFSGL